MESAATPVFSKFLRRVSWADVSLDVTHVFTKRKIGRLIFKVLDSVLLNKTEKEIKNATVEFLFFSTLSFLCLLVRRRHR